MTIEQAQEWRDYYKNLGFDVLAAAFNEICQNFSDYQTKIYNLNERITTLENQLTKAIQDLNDEKGKNEDGKQKCEENLPENISAEGQD